MIRIIYNFILQRLIDNHAFPFIPGSIVLIPFYL